MRFLPPARNIIRAVLAMLIVMTACGLARAQERENKKSEERRERPAPRAKTAPPAEQPRPRASATPPAERPVTTPSRPSTSDRAPNRTVTPPPADAGPRPGGDRSASRPGNGYGGNRQPNFTGSESTNTGGAPSRDYAGPRRGSQPVTGRGTPNPAFSTPVRTVTTRGGIVGRVDTGGRITSIRGNGITINRGARGDSTIITQRADHTRLVSMGPRRGFVERPLERNGRPYIQRTYVVNGRSYARVYRGSYYHGAVYYRYVPAVIFAPGFYGWASRPWGVRVAFNWGWGPWFGYYGYYFNPYPVYVDSSQWLTDYVISQQLQDAYNAGYNAGTQGQGGPPDPGSAAALTPELKQAISDEVRGQLTAQQGFGAPPSVTSGGDQTPEALDPKFRTFIVSTTLVQQLASGAECPLGPGDVLTRIDDTPDANQSVRVLVSSSQANDCPAGSQFQIAVQDLQDMHNNFRERVDAGLDQLAQNQGKNGIPPGPAANPTQSPDGVAQPDPNAQTDLQQQEQTGQQYEQDVQDSAR